MSVGPEEVIDPSATFTDGGAATPATESENPAWATALEKFPEGVRGIAREQFAEWDAGVQKRFQTIHEQYAPYKPFIDNKVDPNQLQEAYTFAQTLTADPQGTVKLLAQHLGISLQEAQQVVEEVEGEQNQEIAPEIQALQDNLAQMAEYIQNKEAAEQQQQLIAQQDAEVSDGFLAIEQEIGGKLDPRVKNQVLQQMLYDIEVSGKPSTVRDAFNKVNEFVTAIRQPPRPGATAPRLVPSGNAAAVTPPDGKSLGSLSTAERKAYAAAVMAAQLGN